MPQALRTQAMKACHDTPVVVYKGVSKTMDLVARPYWWPRMQQINRRYIHHCRICRTTKPGHLPYQGLLQSLPIPFATWDATAVDFVTGLPKCKSGAGTTYDNMMEVTNMLSKQIHLVPIGSSKVENIARLFLKYVWSHHAMPLRIVSDRDR